MTHEEKTICAEIEQDLFAIIDDFYFSDEEKHQAAQTAVNQISWIYRRLIDLRTGKTEKKQNATTQISANAI